MRLVTAEVQGRLIVGAVEGETVVHLADAARAAGRVVEHMFDSILSLLETGERAMDAARAALRFAVERPDGPWRTPLNAARLRAPVPNPPKIFALAGNYAEHIREGGGQPPAKSTTVPQVFIKPVTVIAGPGDPVRIPGGICTAVDYEGELGVVIGRRGKNIPAATALDYVAGYVNFNDISGRSLNITIPRESTPRTAFFDWLNGKWFDTFGPIGPYLVTRDDVPDPQALMLQTRVNGELRQYASTGDMIFGVAETIAWISQFVTLQPGDIIATGTPSGVGAATGRLLQPGDVVEVEITGLGVLRNPVVA
jgi:2-keto-4-pentenoate hydratase/2-oxohepta-3-ene-1,7-dioic acid hydratase in catechol pathway